MKRRLLKFLAVLSILSMIVACLPVEAIAAPTGPKVLLVHDSSDPYGERLYVHASKALEYAKIPFDTFDLDRQASLVDPGGYGAVVVATESLYRLEGNEALKVKQYVSEGGGLVVLYRTWNPLLREVFGIYNRREPEFSTSGATVRFNDDTFLGAQGMVLDQSLLADFTSFNLLLLDSAEVLVSSVDGKRPFVWLNHYGQGRVIYWNTDWLAAKEFRGYIVQSVLAVQPVAISSLVNTAVFDIDDYPAPSSTQKREPVGTEFGLSLPDFYHKVWYPDMMELAERYGIKYTWIVPFNYNGRTSPPYDDYGEWVDATININGQKVPLTAYYSHICAQNGEMALHGYDHESLLLRNWGTVDNMVLSLESAAQRWEQDGLGPLPFTYIAPNNLFDAAGLEALHRAFPSIKVVSGVDFGPFEEGSDREFGPEPWNEALFSFPRWTDGYALDDRTQMIVASEMGMFGLWTHFVHPDDVINTPTNYPNDDPKHIRNPKELPWRGEKTGKNGMYYGLVNMLEYVKGTYPWLRYMTTKDAYYELQGYLDTAVTYDLSNPKELTISYKGSPAYFWVRLNDGRKVDLSALTNAQVVHIYEGRGYNLYLMRAIGEEVRVGLIAR